MNEIDKMNEIRYPILFYQPERLLRIFIISQQKLHPKEQEAVLGIS
jgi:hypothetical protein